MLCFSSSLSLVLGMTGVDGNSWHQFELKQYDNEIRDCLKYSFSVVFQVLLAQYKATGKLYAIKALKKKDIIRRDEIDR